MEKVGGLYGDFNVGDAVGRNRDGDCRRKIRHLTEGLFATTLTNKTWSVLTSLQVVCAEPSQCYFFLSNFFVFFPHCQSISM